MKPLPRLLLSALCCLAWTTAPGQSPAPDANPAPIPPRAEVHSVTVLENGGLLFAVRLHAGSGRPLKLFRNPPKPSPGNPNDPNLPEPLSLAGSLLTNIDTGQTIKPYPLLPKKPYVGPLEVTGEIAPRGWIQLGVAFPPLPPSPSVDGKKQPFRLIFSVPSLDLKTQVALDPENFSIVTKKL